MMRKKLVVNQNQRGFLYDKKKLLKILEPGIYRFWDLRNHMDLLNVPMTERMTNVTNQEVLTSDNVALRFSFTVFYKIEDGEMFLSRFQLEHGIYYILQEADQLIAGLFQLEIRQRISKIGSEELNEKRSEFGDLRTDEVTDELKRYGLEVTKAEVRDITFPKNIQDLFMCHLESKIRAKADLENARTSVATARALKNAAELMKGDDSIRFIQYLETMTKIASKGRHTFVIGEVPRTASENKH